MFKGWKGRSRCQVVKNPIINLEQIMSRSQSKLYNMYEYTLKRHMPWQIIFDLFGMVSS